MRCGSTPTAFLTAAPLRCLRRASAQMWAAWPQCYLGRDVTGRPVLYMRLGDLDVNALTDKFALALEHILMFHIKQQEFMHALCEESSHHVRAPARHTAPHTPHATREPPGLAPGQSGGRRRCIGSSRSSGSRGRLSHSAERTGWTKEGGGCLCCCCFALPAVTKSSGGGSRRSVRTCPFSVRRGRSSPEEASRGWW